jgi:hypothetical protein
LTSPDLLLLDEPTNHLDAESVAWLERFLKEYKGTVVAVTHDRYFLDNVAEWILELDRGMAFPFKGNYSAWLEAKEKRLEVEEKQESGKQRKIKQELEWVRSSPKARHAKSKARVQAFEALVAESSRKKRDPNEISIPPPIERLGDKVIEAKGLTKGYGDHLLYENLDFQDLIPYYTMADVMAVTSLHDGMNLVSKEYVAAKVGMDGVLVLSPFTGASRELEHAIQVSPYDTERLADALYTALTLPEDDRSRRMRALREVVASQNIYDWARKLLRDVRRLHLVPGTARPAPRR